MMMVKMMGMNLPEMYLNFHQSLPIHKKLPVLMYQNGKFFREINFTKNFMKLVSRCGFTENTLYNKNLLTFLFFINVGLSKKEANFVSVIPKMDPALFVIGQNSYLKKEMF